MQYITIYGHSHVWSVRRASGGWSHPKMTVEIPYCGTKDLPGDIVRSNGDGLALNDLIANLVTEKAQSSEADQTWLVSMVQGNYYNQMGMFAEDHLFALEQPSESDGTVVLPVEAIRAELLSRLQSLKSYLQLLSDTEFSGRIIVVGPPPPPESDEEPIKHLEAENASLLLSPQTVRKQLWDLQNKLVSQYCTETGHHYLQGDLPGTCTEAGLLKTAYVKDSVHANHEYSHLLLDEIAEIVSASCARSDV